MTQNAVHRAHTQHTLGNTKNNLLYSSNVAKCVLNYGSKIPLSLAKSPVSKSNVKNFQPGSKVLMFQVREQPY